MTQPSSVPEPVRFHLAQPVLRADAAPVPRGPLVHERLHHCGQVGRAPARRGHVEVQVAVAHVAVPHDLRCAASTASSAAKLPSFVDIQN